MIDPPGQVPEDRRFVVWILVSLVLHLAVWLLLGTYHPAPLPRQKELEVQWIALAPTPPPPPPAGAEPTPPPGPEPPPETRPTPPPARPEPVTRPAPPTVKPEATVRPTPPPTVPAQPKVRQTPPVEPPPRPTPAPQAAPGGAGGSSTGQLPRRLEGLFPGTPGFPQLPPGTGNGKGTGAGSGAGTGSGTGSGTGLVPIPEVKERIQRDARQVIARDRVARGLVTPEMNHIGSKLEAAWDIELRDVHRWPVKAETRVEYWTPPGLEAEAAVTPPCPYRRYSLALVTVLVDRDGGLISAEISRSSGSRRWDREAIDLVERAQPFPPPAARDLDAQGHSRSVWDIGARDYSLSTCVQLGGSWLVKDIVLVEAYINPGK